jgi:predicted ester cyclase
MVSCARSNDAVEVKNREVVRSVFSEIWSKGNVNLDSELFSENDVGRFPGETVHGPEGLVTQVLAHRTAFPDWTEHVEDEIVDGDRIAVRFTSRGTNMGDFFGNPPTGNIVEISEVVMFGLMNGKIREQWVYPDILNLQRQLRPKEGR